jgi:hypothetical protein
MTGIFQGTVWSVVSIDSIYLDKEGNNKNYHDNLSFIGDFNWNAAG